MNAVSVALIIITLLSTCMWSVLLCRLWSLRRSFKIAARAPDLVGVCGTSTLAVLTAIFVHWVMLVDGKGLPCFVMFLVSYLWHAVGMLPYCLRAFRLVIVYNTQYRLRYAQYVKRRHLNTIWAVIGTGITAGALLVLYYTPERYSRDHYGCFFFNERRTVELTLVLGVGPTAFIMFKLMKGQDVFGIGPEIVNVIVPVMVGGVIIATVQELLNANVLEDSRAVHLLLEMVVVVVFSNLLYWSILVPVADHHGWCTGRRNVLPIEGSTSSSVRDNEGVFEYAEEGGEVAALFGDFCRQSLCMESWDFIVDAVAYKKLTNPHEQFASFTEIMDQYLRPRSPQEVNLGHKMQHQLLQFQTRSSFTSLREDTRRAILDAPAREIVMMLEQNILAKFKQTPTMKRLERRTRRIIDMQPERDASSGGKDRTPTITSVSTNIMASSRKSFLTV